MIFYFRRGFSLYLWFYLCFALSLSLNGMGVKELKQIVPVFSSSEEGEQEPFQGEPQINGQNDEGWRFRCFPVIKDCPSIVFKKIHEDMMEIERQVSNNPDLREYTCIKKTNQLRNIALARFSLLTQQEGSTSLTEIVTPLFEDINSLVFLSGCYRDQQKQPLHGDYYHIISELENLTIIQALPLNKERLAQWLELSIEGKETSALRDAFFYRNIEHFLGVAKQMLFFAGVAENRGDANGLVKKLEETVKKDIDGCNQLENRFLHSEQLLMQYLNSTDSQRRIRRNIKQIKGKQIVAGIVMHLYTRMNPCENCAPMLFRECEREHGFAKNLQRVIADQQDGILPFFILLVSFTEDYKKGGFSGIDKESEIEGLQIDPASVANFYPVVRLVKHIEVSSIDEDEAGRA